MNRLILLLFFFGLKLNNICLASDEPLQNALISSAQNQTPTQKELSCFGNWVEEIKKGNSSDFAIKEKFSKALQCIDPCITYNDAQYLAYSCYDWKSFQKLYSKKEKFELHEALNLLFETKMMTCSTNELTKLKQERTLDGVYYNLEENRCYDPNGDEVTSFLKNSLNIGIGAVALYGTNGGFKSDVAGGVLMEAGAGVIYRNEGAIYQIELQLNGSFLSPSEKYAPNLSEEDRTRSTAEAYGKLEAAIYKTLNPDGCTGLMGGKIYGKFNTAGAGRMQYKALDASAQASVGLFCSFPGLFWHITLNGDLIRAAAFQIPNQFQKASGVTPSLTPALSHIGRQFDISNAMTFDRFAYKFGLGKTTFLLDKGEIDSYTIQGEAYYKHILVYDRKNPSGMYFGARVEYETYEIELPTFSSYHRPDAFTGHVIGGYYF